MLPGRPLGRLVDPLWCQVHAFVIFETNPCERVPSFGTHFRYSSAVFFCWSLNIYKKGSGERCVVRVETKTYFWILSDPLGSAGACTPAQFSLFRPRPSRHHLWSNFGIKLEPEISTILFRRDKWGHLGSKVEVKFCGLAAVGRRGGP